MIFGITPKAATVRPKMPALGRALLNTAPLVSAYQYYPQTFQGQCCNGRKEVREPFRSYDRGQRRISEYFQEHGRKSNSVPLVVRPSRRIVPLIIQKAFSFALTTSVACCADTNRDVQHSQNLYYLLSTADFWTSPFRICIACKWKIACRPFCCLFQNLKLAFQNCSDSKSCVWHLGQSFFSELCRVLSHRLFRTRDGTVCNMCPSSGDTFYQPKSHQMAYALYTGRISVFP